MIVQAYEKGGFAASDPQIQAMMTCLAQICVCLKDEFKQFLPVIVPSLLKDMDRDVKFSFEDAEEPEE